VGHCRRLGSLFESMMLEISPCSEDRMPHTTIRRETHEFLGKRLTPPYRRSGGRVVSNRNLIPAALGGYTLLYNSHIPVPEAAS
jgi:hypothetical protein